MLKCATYIVSRHESKTFENANFANLYHNFACKFWRSVLTIREQAASCDSPEYYC